MKTNLLLVVALGSLFNDPLEDTEIVAKVGWS